MGRHKGRYDWLGGEPAARPEEVRDEAPEEGGAGPVPEASGAGTPGGGVGTARALVSGGTPTQRTRRRRRDPNALRNDPSRKVVGAYVRKDIKREVDRALSDERISPDGNGSFSMLVDGLLERWLEERWYALGEGGRAAGGDEG